MSYVRLLAFVVVCIMSIAFSSSADNQQAVERPIPISLPRPAYLPIARAEHINGAVLVDVQVDAAEGKVIEATPIAGPEILRKVSKETALQSRFKPFKSSGSTYSVRLTYLFFEESNIASTKEPDFKSPYQIEIIAYSN